MPSFCIRDWSVVRLRPRREAAPCGPPNTQLLSGSARRIELRSVISGVVAPAKGARDAERVTHLDTTVRRPVNGVGEDRVHCEPHGDEEEQPGRGVRSERPERGERDERQ